MGMAVNGVGWLTPAADSASSTPARVAFGVYQVPISIMAYFPVRKSLLASGYCWTASAPGSMIPSVNRDFHIVRVWTRAGLVHSVLPSVTSVQVPGETLSAISCSVSWLKPVEATPWTKQPTPCALNTAQSETHWLRVAGGVTPYFWNRFSLIHRVPAKMEPIERAASFPLLVVSVLTPPAASFDFQPGPSAFSAVGVRSRANPPQLVSSGPGVTSKTSGPRAPAASPGRMASATPVTGSSL